MNRALRRKVLRYAQKHGIAAAIEKFNLPMDADAIMARARKNLMEQAEYE